MTCALAAAAVAAVGFGQYANAGIDVFIFEAGGNVETTFSGTFDLDATGGLHGNFNGYNGFLPDIGAYATGGNVDTYFIDALEWTRYGPGGFGNWDVFTGDAFVLFTDPVLGLPGGYVSGDFISGTTTKFGATLASLGMDIGNYTTLITGASGVSDYVTIHVAIPAPGALALLGVAGLLGRRRRRA